MISPCSDNLKFFLNNVVNILTAHAEPLFEDVHSFVIYVSLIRPNVYLHYTQTC